LKAAELVRILEVQIKNTKYWRTADEQMRNTGDTGASADE